MPCLDDTIVDEHVVVLGTRKGQQGSHAHADSEPRLTSAGKITEYRPTLRFQQDIDEMRRLLLASAALLAASLVSGATVLYVDCDHGHDTPGGGTSPVTALRTPNYARDLVRGKAPATVEIVGDCYPGNASSPVTDFSQVGGRAHGVDKCMRHCVCAHVEGCGVCAVVRGMPLGVHVQGIVLMLNPAPLLVPCPPRLS